MTLDQAALAKALGDLSRERHAHAATRTELEELKAAVYKMVDELEHSSLLSGAARASVDVLRAHEVHRHRAACHELDARPTPPETPTAKAVEAALRALGPADDCT